MQANNKVYLQSLFMILCGYVLLFFSILNALCAVINWFLN